MNPPEREVHLERLVSATRAIIGNQIGLPTGCAKVHKVLFWLKLTNHSPYQVFGQYIHKLNEAGVPFGAERLHWEKKALSEQDKLLFAATKKHYDAIMAACWLIIEEHGEPTKLSKAKRRGI